MSADTFGRRPTIERIDRAFTRTNKFVVAALLAIMALLVFANVVMRYVLGISLSWVEEVTRYMMIWVAWLAIGLAMREGAHVVIDTLQHVVRPALAKTLRLAILASTVVFFVAVAWLGLRYAIFAWGQNTAVLRISLGAVYLAIPIGSILMLIHLCFMAPRMIAHELTAEEQAQAAEMSVL